MKTFYWAMKRMSSNTPMRCVPFVLLLGALWGAPSVGLAQSVSDAGACRADVVFLMDNTGSMGGPINSTKRNARTILDAISGDDPRFAGIDTLYGVATYWGDPREYLTTSSIWFCHRDT
jgi:hypothetical protein